MNTEQNRNLLSVLAIAAALMGAVAMVHLGNVLTPVGGEFSWNPVALLIEVATGAVDWPPAATWLVGGELVAAAAALMVWGTHAPSKTQEAARRMSPAGRIRPVTATARSTEAARLHPDAAGIGPGLTIGTFGKQTVYQGWRECSAHVWGTGRGKTTSQVVRHATQAPGAFVMTSNKVDGVGEVMAARAGAGGVVWMFDPQRIWRASGRPSMIFDLLATVTDTMSAGEVASIFETASAAGSAGGKGDPQFDSQGRDYLSWCLLAAAKTGKTLSDVLRWVSSADFLEPAQALEQAGHTGPAAAVEGMGRQPEDTRGSVAASAQRMSSALVHDELLAWTTPTPGVPVFDPHRFATSKDTLILLAQDTAGSGAAFVSCLVYAVFTAAQEAARRAGGRLAVPLVADLDEVGNVVKLKQLPEWFSFFGSMGIVVSAYFQTRGQGEEMLRRTGWDTLWSAAAIKVYGGGSDDTEFLGAVSKLIGTYEAKVHSTSTSRTGGSRTTQSQQREIMPVAKLAELPANHAWVKTSTAGGTIVTTLPWFKDKELTSQIVPTLERIKEAQEA